MIVMLRLASLFFLTLAALLAPVLTAQSLGNAGTIDGTVVDPSGAGVPKAAVAIHNPVTGYRQAVESGTDGSFHLSNVPPNSYHLEVAATGFTTFTQELVIRNSLPVQVKATLAIAGSVTNVTVEGAADALETDPTSHVDVD